MYFNTTVHNHTIMHIYMIEKQYTIVCSYQLVVVNSKCPAPPLLQTPTSIITKILCRFTQQQLYCRKIPQKNSKNDLIPYTLYLIPYTYYTYYKYTYYTQYQVVHILQQYYIRIYTIFHLGRVQKNDEQHRQQLVQAIVDLRYIFMKLTI